MCFWLESESEHPLWGSVSTFIEEISRKTKVEYHQNRDFYKILSKPFSLINLGFSKNIKKFLLILPKIIEKKTVEN